MEALLVVPSHNIYIYILTGSSEDRNLATLRVLYSFTQLADLHPDNILDPLS